jgi:uncharacterized protein YqeY
MDDNRMSDSIKQRLTDDVKSALRTRDKQRLGTLRLINAAIKQREIDERTTLDDRGVIGVLQKMSKQRGESIKQYELAERQDLVQQESFELQVIQDYMPTPLDDASLEGEIDKAVAEAGAETMKDMGKVMAILGPRLQGRAQMGEVSAKVKERLSG